LEKVLHIKLIEEAQEIPIKKNEEPKAELTFGDLVRIKEKKSKK